MKLTVAILGLGLGLSTAWAQNPDVIDNTRNTLQNLQKKQTIDQNAALTASGQGQSSAPASSPAAVSAPAKSVQSKAAQGTPAAASVSPASAKPGKTPVVSVTPAKAKTPAAKGKKKSTAIAVKPSEPQQKVAVEDKKVPVEPKKEETKNYSANGRRDPFISPVVNRTMTGSGCSTGKRCLAIDQINLQGIVKSDAGMIAVVVNALNKAYFLRENDPVFNGYVVKITGDSIIFKETLQDKMGKSFEREVTKRISTPAV